MATELETLVVTLEASIKQYERQLARAQGTTVKTMRQIEGEVTRGGRRVSERMGETGRETANAFLKGFGLGRIGRGGIGLYLVEEFLRFARDIIEASAKAGDGSSKKFLAAWDNSINKLEVKVGSFFGEFLNYEFEWAVNYLNNIIAKFNELGGKHVDLIDLRSLQASPDDAKERLKSLEAIAKQGEEIAKLNEDLRFEESLIGKTALQQAILNNLRKAGVTAESQYGQAIIESTTLLYSAQQRQLKIEEEQKKAQDELQKQQEAYQREVEQFANTLENSATNFVDSLLDGVNATEALHNALKDLARDLLHMGLHQIFSTLFPTEAGATSPIAALISSIFTRAQSIPQGPGGLAPVPVTGHPISPIPGSNAAQTFGALVTGTESSSSLIGGAKQDLLDAKSTLEKAQSDLESPFGITHEDLLHFTPGGKIADRIKQELDYPVYKPVGQREYLPLDTKETTYQPIDADKLIKPVEEASKAAVKSSRVFADATKKVADTTMNAGKQFGKVFPEGLNQVIKGLSSSGGGFPNLSTWLGLGMGGGLSSGAAWEHSVPFLQHGGQFRVGGAGGTDSQLVAFHATPGEMVTVSPNRLSHGRGHGGIVMGGTVINIEGSADEKTVAAIDRRIAANNYRQRKALERDWGAMSMRYQQLRG